MGYYAQSDWNLTIVTSLPDLAADIRNMLDGHTYWPLSEADADLPHDLMREVNEEADAQVRVDASGKGTWRGWGGGKCLSLASDDSVWSMLAKHCVGTVDWHGEDESYSRIRLYGNGEFREFAGEVVYPQDTAALVGA
jgi:hypothetical protein